MGIRKEMVPTFRGTIDLLLIALKMITTAQEAILILILVVMERNLVMKITAATQARGQDHEGAPGEISIKIRST